MNFSNVSDSGVGMENESFIYDDDPFDPCLIRNMTEVESEKDFFHFLVYGIFLNTVGIMGLIGNGISISILSRKHMRSSINCCLVGLASFDTIVLTSSIIMFGLPAIPEYTGQLMWYQMFVFPWITLVAYPLGMLAQTGSVYLTVTVTIERYVAVCHPLKAKSLCTFGRAKIYVVTVAIFSIVYNFSRFWEITYAQCSGDDVDFTTVVMTDLRKSHVYIEIYITWMYLLFMYLVPFISLTVFNTFIYKQIRSVKDFRVKLRRQSNLSIYGPHGRKVRLANQERQRLSRLQRKELTLAAMLLVVVIVFFFCNILAFIVNVLEMFDVAIAYLTMLSNFLVTVNSSVNFIIYCIFGQKFRRLFLQMFCFGACGQQAADVAVVNSGYANSVHARSLMMANGRGAATQSMRLSSWTGSSRVAQNHWATKRRPSSLMAAPSNLQPTDHTTSLMDNEKKPMEEIALLTKKNGHDSSNLEDSRNGATDVPEYKKHLSVEHRPSTIDEEVQNSTEDDTQPLADTPNSDDLI